MGKRITDKVTWVGKIDWELKTFHGDELSTHKGTSYNSYLIRDEKTVLMTRYGILMTRSLWPISRKRSTSMQSMPSW